MITDFLIVAGQVLTLFLMMGVGFALERKGWFSRETTDHCTKLMLYVVSPCIIISQFQIEASMEVIHSMLLSAVGMAVPYLFSIPLSHLLFRREEPDTAVVRRFGIIYGNNSFMGFPLLAGILGKEAMLFGVIAALIFNTFEWTQGVALMGGKLSLKRMVLNPGILGLVAGLLLFGTGLRLPGPVNGAVSYLADLNTPLAMVIIGAQMSRSGVLNVLKKPMVYVTSALKLVVMPAVTALVLLPLGMEPLSYCASVILAACPAAGVTAMFAQMFRRDEETASQMVTLSTLLSLVTLPVFALLARTVSGLG